MMHKYLLVTVLVLVVIYLFRTKIGSFLNGVGAGAVGGWLSTLAL